MDGERLLATGAAGEKSSREKQRSSLGGRRRDEERADARDRTRAGELDEKGKVYQRG